MAGELKPYCTECDADLVVDKNGIIACECGETWRQGDNVLPPTWVDKHKNLLDLTTLKRWVEERL